MNTWSSADGISDNGVIVGTGVHKWRDSCLCDGAANSQPNPDANSNCYAHVNSNSCAKSYSYTKGASDAALATVASC